MKKYKNLIATLLLFVSSFLILELSLCRPFWCDESLTIMEFVMWPYVQIYTNYSIPNNHILFNMLLRLWLDTGGHLFAVSEIPFRFLSLIFSLAVICFMFHFWRKHFGFKISFLITLCFAVSTPFIIYGTAIRGYMLSLLFVLFGIESMQNWWLKAEKRYLCFYFLSALAAVAVIPSNLLVFCILPLLPTKKDFQISSSESPKQQSIAFLKSRLLLFLIPMIAFLIFYGPLFKNMFKAIKFNSGWNSPVSALGHLYSAFIISLLPIVILGIMGLFSLSKLKRKQILKGVLFGLIFLIPGALLLTRNPAPFPRIFFQMWPLWLFILGCSAKHFFSFIKHQSPAKYPLLFPIILSAIITWGYLQNRFTSELSQVMSFQEPQDDFFLPYYMSDNFRPLKTLAILEKSTGGAKQSTFLSTDSDFRSIIFYGKMQGIPYDTWLFDLPKQPIKQLPATGKEFFFVCHDETDKNNIIKRFNLSKVKLLEDNGFQKVFSGEIKSKD